MLENRTCKTNGTFIGLGVDDVSEFDKLRVEGLNHIAFVDRQNLTDCNPVSYAQKKFEVVDHLSKEMAGRHRINAPGYGCSCSKCREFKGSDFLFKEYRHVKHVILNKSTSCY